MLRRFAIFSLPLLSWPQSPWLRAGLAPRTRSSTSSTGAITSTRRCIDAFTKETGIKVVYDTYDSNEVLETKLLAGHTGYDVVVPSATFLQRQIAAGVLQPLDKSRLPNLKNLSPEIEARLAAYDPGNKYAVDYMWFTTGIAYNAAKAKERLGTAPITSWDIVFKPDLLRKFSDCGVYVLDSPEDMLTIALRYLKLDPEFEEFE